MKRRNLLHAVATGTALALLLVSSTQLFSAACGREAQLTPTADASTDGISVDTISDRGSKEKLDHAVKDSPNDTHTNAQRDTRPLPDGVPVGWEEWTEWSEDCPLYIPGENAQMPPPIQWEPCPKQVPSYLHCRAMKDTWSGQNIGVGPEPLFAIDAKTKKPLLFFERMNVGGNRDACHTLVAEIDGRVRNANMQFNHEKKVCFYIMKGLGSTHYGRYVHSYIFTDSDPPWSNERFGFIGGPIDKRTPAVVFQPPGPPHSMSWFASDQWIVQLDNGQHIAWSWDLQHSHVAYSADGGPAPHKATIVGEDIFSQVGDTHFCAVTSWNRKHGNRPLLWWNDGIHGAGNFGTDGKDMVWTFGTDNERPCNVRDQQAIEVWTAPYTTDPEQVKKTSRRLRTDIDGMSPFSYEVGFGYAIRVDGPSGLFVVRLADGAASYFSRTSEYAWANATGISQDEVFATVHLEHNGIFTGITVFRIRLDSIPFDMPPD